MKKQTKEQAIKEAIAKCPYREMCEKGFTCNNESDADGYCGRRRDNEQT